ncbi:hypothetical protein KAZ93_04885 [Patescibacteria group bacterium]|nr:hypothetical protein [Patescibacteria group bacterium]
MLEVIGDRERLLRCSDLLTESFLLLSRADRLELSELFIESSFLAQRCFVGYLEFCKCGGRFDVLEEGGNVHKVVKL